MIKVGRRHAATKNSAHETIIKRYVVQVSRNFTFALDRSNSAAAISKRGKRKSNSKDKHSNRGLNCTGEDRLTIFAYFYSAAICAGLRSSSSNRLPRRPRVASAMTTVFLWGKPKNHSQSLSALTPALFQLKIFTMQWRQCCVSVDVW